jgi:NodT family efflux transporter outer membrane factor (OMF) lipoprotein
MSAPAIRSLHEMRYFAAAAFARSFAAPAVAAFCLAAVLCGCINGRGIKPEASYIDTASVDTGVAVRDAARSAGWPTDTWWAQWDDPQLDQLVTRAAAGSPTLAIVQSRLTAAIWQASALRAYEFPEVDGRADFARARFPRYGGPSPPGGTTVWRNSAAIDLYYDLDLWGKNRARASGAEDIVHASAADAQFALLELQVAIVRIYNQLAVQYALLDVYQTINDDEKHNFDIATARRQAGIGSNVELSQAATQYKAGIADIVSTRNAIALARLQIAYLVGEGPGFGDSLTRPKPPGEKNAELPTSLPAELIGHRPDVVASRWRAEAAARAIDVAHAEFYPNVDLVATASLLSTAQFGGFFNFVNSDAIGHSVGVAISLPIFDAGRRRGNYGVATAEYDEAVLKYNDTVLAAMQNVAQQVTSLQSLAVQQSTVEDALVAAQQSYRLATRGFASGITEYLDVLVAQKAMLQQERDLVLVQGRRVDEWALLMRDLGGGIGPIATPDSISSGADHAR